MLLLNFITNKSLINTNRTALDAFRMEERPSLELFCRSIDIALSSGEYDIYISQKKSYETFLAPQSVSLKFFTMVI